MKFATIITILAAISGAYSMVIKRDTPVKKVIIDLTAALGELDATANDFDGNIQPVVDAADHVISLIGSGQSTAEGAASIEFFDAVALLEPVKELDDHAKTFFNDVKDRVDDVRKAKQCGVIREKLGIVNTTGQKLVDTILNKVTSAQAQAQAKPYVDDIKSLLDKSQDLFVEGNCVNAS
ncbi:hypothetical protein BGZ59_001475 [Podila verticillata]|uniref:Hydrophobic surface binding protein n=1 Tax=Podila verticillata NRRL 6337 TaxID=1069443 RepID=A0A086TIY7_9FUNG|nr:hypothetical protein BGZ59_001475 [Podila verticillata]KFH61914.1 hypothetical protein MVEG_12248 [Podila verticillata NRRL 6337]